MGGRRPAGAARGGLGVRDLRRAATVLDLDEVGAAFVAELAYVAGLLAPDTEIEQAWRPTPAYDLWRAPGPGAAVGGAGRRLAADGPARRAGRDPGRSGPAARRPWGPTWTAHSPPTCAPACSPSLPRSPRGRRDRRGGHRPAGVVLARAGAGGCAPMPWPGPCARPRPLGVLGLGAMSAPGRALVADPDDEDALESALIPLLPIPLDHVLLQADLTAVAPGPAGDRPRPGAGPARRCRVHRRGDGVPVHRRLRAPRARRRPLRGGRAPVARLPLAYARAAAVDLPRRRRRAPPRPDQGGRGLRPTSAPTTPACSPSWLADRRTAPLRLRRLAPTVLAAAASGRCRARPAARAGLRPGRRDP